MRCEFVGQWGRCTQPSRDDGLCSFHEHWQPRMFAGLQPDRAYHEKICRGLLSPTFDFLTESEIRATTHGRRHQDGRRLDLYASFDPIEDWSEDDVEHP